MKVCKFGGTSMANSKTILKVVDIIESDLSRHYIVVSAPGKRTPEDIKVTDALYACFNDVKKMGNCNNSFKVVEKRFREIVQELGVDIDIDNELKTIKEGIEKSTTPDYAASRGEYLSAKILAMRLNYDFVDAYDLIKFNEKGELLGVPWCAGSYYLISTKSNLQKAKVDGEVDLLEIALNHGYEVTNKKKTKQNNKQK